MAWPLDLSWLEQGHNARSRQHWEPVHYCSVGNIRRQAMLAPVLVAVALLVM